MSERIDYEGDDGYISKVFASRGRSLKDLVFTCYDLDLVKRGGHFVCNSYLHMTDPLFSHFFMDITTVIDVQICKTEEKHFFFFVFAKHIKMQLDFVERFCKDQ